MEPQIEDELDTNADEGVPSIRDSLLKAVKDTSAPELAEPEPSEPAEGETQEQAAQRARDEAGRFAKEKAAKGVKPAVVKPGAKPAPVVALKPGAKPVVPAAAVKAAPPAAPAVPTSAQVEIKPPQSWKEGAKAAWAQVPEAARLEVLRREKEITGIVAAAGEDRKYASTMKQAFAPFEAQIRAEGSTPEAAIGKLLNTAMALRTAPPAHKARLVASMITDFNIPLEPLVAALQGQPAPQGQPQQPQQQNVDPAAIAEQVRAQLMQQLGAQRDSSLVAKANEEINALLEKQPMHGPDGTDYSEEIRADMADIIERKAARGLKISLEAAYSLAAREHPEVSKVLAKQERAAVAAKTPVSTQRARAAASSVRHESATQPVTKAEGSSLRDTLKAAFAANSER